MVPSGPFCGCPPTPIILGILGPWMSASRSPTAAPVWASVTARLTAMVDFPTPPLPLATASTCSLIRSCDSLDGLLIERYPCWAPSLVRLTGWQPLERSTLHGIVFHGV